MIIEVVGEAVTPYVLGRDLRLLNLFDGHVPQRDCETIAVDVLGSKRTADLTEVLQFEQLLRQRFPGTVMHRHELCRQRVLVLEAAIADASTRDLPAINDGVDHLGRSDRLLGQPIQRKLAGRWSHLRQLINQKVFGQPF